MNTCSYFVDLGILGEAIATVSFKLLSDDSVEITSIECDELNAQGNMLLTEQIAEDDDLIQACFDALDDERIAL